MSFQERVQVQTWQRLERSSYGWERQQLRQQTNDTGQRDHTDCLKFRIGGRSRSIPAVQRFNQRIRKRKSDQAYENHDLESPARHNQV